MTPTAISRRALLASALASPRPNILFLCSDQQHWRALGCQDGFFDTPHLDRLAAESFLFENSFCSTPQCSPSRSSLMTGLYPSKTGVWGNIGAAGGNDLRMTTVGARLEEAGYHTGYFGKWHLGGDPEANRGWREEWKQQKDPEVTRRGIEFLKARGQDRKPFALFLMYLDPHDVYQYRPGRKDVSQLRVPLPASWQRESFQGKPAPQKQFMTDDQGTVIWGREQRFWEEYRDFYRTKVRLYDEEAGKVIEAARAAGLLENTVVVATSDHGDMDANHQLVFKGPFMYEHMVRIPLLVRMPGGKGRRVRDLDTVNVDLAPTLLDFAGAKVPACDGLSLKPLLAGSGQPRRRDFVISEYYSKQSWVNPIRMIRAAGWKYNRYQKHGEELYDLTSDPEELVNLAADAGYRKKKAELAAELDRWIEARKDPFTSQWPTDRRGVRL